MNYEVQRVIREWDIEVDTEAVRLIREGTPPFDAVEQATKIVQRRRQDKERREMAHNRTATSVKQMREQAADNIRKVWGRG